MEKFVSTLAGVGIMVALVTLSLPFSAQAAEKEKVSWYEVSSLKFKSGKTEEALKIIHDHFQKVDKTIGRRVIPFDFQTGEWDHVVYFPSDPGQMDTIPSRDVWWKAFAEQEGGREKAQELFQRFWDLVANSKSEIARLPAAWAP